MFYQRRQRRQDAQLGACARAVTIELDRLESDVDTYRMVKWTKGVPLSKPQERANAITNIVVVNLPKKIQGDLLGISGVDAERAFFSIHFSAVRLALPPRIAAFIVDSEGYNSSPGESAVAASP